jgi:hypothetical protein
MTAQTVGYKAKAFEPRNLALFFLIAFGWSWLFWWLLYLSGIVSMPGGIGPQNIDLGSSWWFKPLGLLSPYGPTLAAFVMTAIIEGRTYKLLRGYPYHSLRSGTGSSPQVVNLTSPSPYGEGLFLILS